MLPETTTALLVCEGKCQKPTRHDYDSSVSVNDPDLITHTHFLQLFECRRCGHTRVWGTHE